MGMEPLNSPQNSSIPIMMKKGASGTPDVTEIASYTPETGVDVGGCIGRAKNRRLRETSESRTSSTVHQRRERKLRGRVCESSEAHETTFFTYVA